METETSQGSKKKDFWDRKARTFPRFEEGEDTYEAGMLNRIREHGVDFRDATVLDVGCGSGMYTIRLAREAKQVTAVDISDTMLDILRQDAEEQGLGNIDYVRSEWMDFDSDATFDIVFCSMTPAIQDDESRFKLLSHAGRWTVFMGFDGVMNSDIMTGLYAHYGVTPRKFVNGTEMRHWLDSHAIPYTRYPIEGTWVTPKNLEMRMDGAATFLSQYGVTADQDHLERYMARFEEEPGVYVEHTDYKIDLLIWENRADA
ncbi:class I SAM-dependent methyltransferase [Pseudodesulfovibrio portus]|uniref:SAM-dependent methyltransferase n=1 Tax=Pseudodesulfovibrio portus TaxID=231439 RepID=A0ABN6RUX8_9BACT|nr:class I SAM-dependent methyltransferase [Pseudodesulfovibrio portus]BDQ33653.1 SAM-dependent methyltransferase [Pseudodesulfovibrio portus]